jgi:enoyl-CoA hydratase/carnithine racemase
MLTTGDFLPAPRAREVGLVNRTAPPDQLSQETRKLAETLAAKLTAAVHIGKRTFYDQQGLSLSDAYALTGDRMTENMLWRDTEEGIAAFLEKRKPDWS